MLKSIMLKSAILEFDQVDIFEDISPTETTHLAS